MKIIKSIIVSIMMISMLFALVACNKDVELKDVTPNQNEQTETEAESNIPEQKYSITLKPLLSSASYGDFTLSKESAAAGETITIRVSIKEAGCYIDYIKVEKDEKQSIISVSNEDDNYSFIMPAGDVTIKIYIVKAYKEVSGNPDYITFGSWPQTVKKASVTIDNNNKKTVGMFTYFKGSDNAWYVLSSENAFEPGYKYSDGTEAKQHYDSTSRYFKVEPIKWRVVKNAYNHKKLLIADKVLVNCQFFDNSNQNVVVDRNINGGKIRPNNYEYSKLRAYLNGYAYPLSSTENNDTYFNKGFLQTAFNEKELSVIAETLVDNSSESTHLTTSPNLWNDGNNLYACSNTTDKIFLLSTKDVTTTTFGFNSDHNNLDKARVHKNTDYALASGVITGVPSSGGQNVGGAWWLRSPFCNPPDYEDNGFEITTDGQVDCMGVIVTSSYYGIVPALCFK